MEIDIKLNPNEICRACLNKSVDMTLLNTKVQGEETTLFEMLIFVTNLDTKINDKMPKQLCFECENILKQANAFKRRCLDADAYLNLHVNNHPQYELELSEKPVIIKDEEVFKKPKTNKVSVKKTEKTNDAELFELLEASACKEEKFLSDVLPVCSTSQNIPDTSIDTVNNDIIKVQLVKEEFTNDFDSDIDFCQPLDYKQETNEYNVLSCSCGTFFTKDHECETHLKTKTCRYKKSMKIKMGKKNGVSRNITVKRKIVCPDCNLEFDTVKACQRHQRQHGADETGVYQCTYCMRKFNRLSSYTTHINHHDAKSKIKYTCEVCKREFQHKAHLDNHVVAVHSRDKGFTCELCQMNFSTEESLELHKESHKTEKKHQCNICQKAFIMLSTLTDHMRTHTGERPFLCSICGRGFSQRTNLAQHMRRHQGLKPFKCEECDRRFVSKGELVAHTRKHSGAHPFVCDDCGSGFTTSSSLVKHRRIHTGERPYACDLCPMKFAASGTLKNHRRTHTGEKPFQCSYCEKAFVQRQDLVSHIRCHTGERPYGCGCGQTFRKAASLRAHVKSHARDTAHALAGPHMLQAVPDCGVVTSS